MQATRRDIAGIFPSRLLRRCTNLSVMSKKGLNLSCSWSAIRRLAKGSRPIQKALRPTVFPSCLTLPSFPPPSLVPLYLVIPAGRGRCSGGCLREGRKLDATALARPPKAGKGVLEWLCTWLVVGIMHHDAAEHAKRANATGKLVMLNRVTRLPG